MKIDKRLLPVKAHYFFLMAAMGPILPFLPVFGKQLGVSEVLMGSVTAVLPIIFLVAKPAVGLLMDSFKMWRKAIFISFLVATSASFALLYLVQQQASKQLVPCFQLQPCQTQNRSSEVCELTCGSTSSVVNMGAADCYMAGNFSCQDDSCKITCPQHEEPMYLRFKFWSFVLLLALGSIGFNVSNSISDALTFDMLGEGGQMKYGSQRVWGTIGFGISALLGGYAIDWYSQSETKDYTPAFLLCLAFMLIDVACCSKLKLPPLPMSESILRDVGSLVMQPHIAVFLVFATFTGFCDSFIIYYLFWYLEDLASVTGEMGNIKLLEGLTIAAETLGGEVVFFSLSGRILQRVGYGHCLSLCLVAYCIRFGLLSVLPSTWWVLPIELCMQGPSYALAYTTIVAYASAVSPPGASATVQGLVAGMDDGFGYALGSLTGGILYRCFGGSRSFQLFATFALTCSVAHFALYMKFFRHATLLMPTSRTAAYELPTKVKEIVTYES